MLLIIASFAKDGAGKAINFVRASIKKKLTRVKRIVPYFESTESLGKVNVPRHGVHHLQFCCNIYEYELQLHLHCIFLDVSYNYEHASNSQQYQLHILQQCHVTVTC